MIKNPRRQTDAIYHAFLELLFMDFNVRFETRAIPAAHVSCNNIKGLIMLNAITRTILLFSFACLSSCTTEKNPFKYSDISVYPLGKAVFDFGSYLVLKPDGTLWSWGKNSDGELGRENKESFTIPTKINALTHIIDFNLSGGMCVAADEKGRIWYWGRNRCSSQHWPIVKGPRAISYLLHVNKVYASGYMIRSDGTVWKIELDTQVDSAFYVPTQVKGLTDIIAISGSYALKNDGNIVDLISSARPAEWGGFIPVEDVIEVQQSISHTVILKRDGAVWAWGQNSIGELGNGTWEAAAEPAQISNLNHIIQISTSYHFNLALKDDGSVWFWGFTATRDEDNHPVGVNVPVRVDDVDHVSYVYANTTCMIIKNDGSYWSFNVNDRIARPLDLP